MSAYFILFAAAVAIVAGAFLLVRRRNARQQRSGVHPEDQPHSPKVK